MTVHTWEKYICEAHDQMIKNNDVRELGKIRAASAEFVAKDWINANTSINVILPYENSDYNDKNGTGFDLYSVKNKTRIQVKYRAGPFHLETTRRNSIKNKGNRSLTGHSAYSTDECDIFFFVVPSKDSSDPMNSKFIAIPTKELENPKNIGFCYTNVPASIIKNHSDQRKTIEILENLKCL